jgi:hypothetical protein
LGHGEETSIFRLPNHAYPVVAHSPTCCVSQLSLHGSVTLRGSSGRPAVVMTSE